MANDTNTEPQGHETSESMKMRIEQKQAELAQAKVAKRGQPLQEGKTPKVEDVKEPVKTEIAEPEKAQSEGVKTEPESVDLKDWAKKKWPQLKDVKFDSETSVLEALRKSEIEFHRKRQEKLKEQAQNAPPVAPVAPQPYQPPYYQPQAYQPPPVPQNQQMLENIGRQYNMAPEDVERLLKFNRDQFEIMQRNYDQQIQQKFKAIQQETQKNTVFQELSSDPAFRNPEVLNEWHRTVEEMQDRDPQSFEDPSSYRRAYDETLKNIGRRYLQGVNKGASKSDIFSPPSNPPRPTGLSGEGALENENELSMAQFEKLDPDEQRKVLVRMGRVQPKY
jgi:hypothetical protein